MTFINVIITSGSGQWLLTTVEVGPEVAAVIKLYRNIIGVGLLAAANSQFPQSYICIRIRVSAVIGKICIRK